jgi:transcriptional regulator with XRE-family HTH domain
MSDQKVTTGYADRIREAMAHGPRPISSVRGLASRVEDQHGDVRGASYGGVRQYHAGAIGTPRLELLQAIADVLDVRWEWLAYGEGEMTEEEERRRRWEERHREGGDGLTIEVGGRSAPRYQMLVGLVVNHHGDLPLSARWLLFHFVNDWFRDEPEGWAPGDRAQRRVQVQGLIEDYFHPLLARPRMPDHQVTALAASLAAAAYLRLDSDQQAQEEDHGTP